MTARTKGIIATLAAVVLCGCPGLLMCIFGAVGATGTPFSTEVNGVTGSAPMSTPLAIALLCGALIFMLIPVVVGFFTLRSKPEPAVVSGPLPPAS